MRGHAAPPHPRIYRVPPAPPPPPPGIHGSKYDCLQPEIGRFRVIKHLRTATNVPMSMRKNPLLVKKIPNAKSELKEHTLNQLDKNDQMIFFSDQKRFIVLHIAI